MVDGEAGSGGDLALIATFFVVVLVGTFASQVRPAAIKVILMVVISAIQMVLKRDTPSPKHAYKSENHLPNCTAFGENVKRPYSGTSHK